MFASLSSFPTLSPVALSPFKKIRSFKNNSTGQRDPPLGSYAHYLVSQSCTARSPQTIIHNPQPTTHKPQTNACAAEAPPLVSPKNNKSPKAGKSPKATGGKVSCVTGDPAATRCSHTRMTPRLPSSVAQVTIKRAKTGWNGNGKGFAHIVTIAVLTSTSEHLEPLPYKPLSDKKRRRQAARVIQVRLASGRACGRMYRLIKWAHARVRTNHQKLARNGLLLGIRREKAAKLIQTNFRVYKVSLRACEWRLRFC
jgi:hypothetical protein